MQVTKIHKDYPDLLFYPEGIIKNKHGKTIGRKSSSKESSTGYVYIQKDKINLAVHRLMYEAFHNVILKKDEHINHINRIRTDNKISNLEIF